MTKCLGWRASPNSTPFLRSQHSASRATKIMIWLTTEAYSEPPHKRSEPAFNDSSPELKSRANRHLFSTFRNPLSPHPGCHIHNREENSVVFSPINEPTSLLSIKSLIWCWSTSNQTFNSTVLEYLYAWSPTRCLQYINISTFDCSIWLSDDNVTATHFIRIYVYTVDLYCGIRTVNNKTYYSFFFVIS